MDVKAIEALFEQHDRRNETRAKLLDKWTEHMLNAFALSAEPRSASWRNVRRHLEGFLDEWQASSSAPPPQGADLRPSQEETEAIRYYIRLMRSI